MKINLYKKPVRVQGLGICKNFILKVNLESFGYEGGEVLMYVSKTEGLETVELKHLDESNQQAIAVSLMKYMYYLVFGEVINE